MEMSSCYKGLPWVESVINDESVPREVKVFIKLFHEEVKARNTSICGYVEETMKGIVSPSAVLKNLKRGSLPPIYCLRYLDFLKESEKDYLEWYMVNKDHVTINKYRKNDVGHIFAKWEGKSYPETALRFSPSKENKYIRRMRRKYQALNYLQRAYELGV
jgi:hypothetical protein